MKNNKFEPFLLTSILHCSINKLKIIIFREIGIIMYKIEQLRGKSLLDTHPKLVMESWNFEKNIDIQPEEVTAGSNKKVWWKCEKGHEWQAIIADRKRGRGCPYCSNQKIWKGYNDLATTNSELLEEWDYEKNEIRPEEVTAGSDKKVWWRCKEGHSWEAKVFKRTSGKGCPYCSNRTIKVGYNDLVTTNPEMLEEWDYERNEIKPTEVSAGMGKKVWWRCKEGHSWETKINNRTQGRNCPYCSGSKKN